MKKKKNPAIEGKESLCRYSQEYNISRFYAKDLIFFFFLSEQFKI